jgi:hypothetical protein
MKIQMTEPVDILALVTAHFPGLVTVLRGLGAQTVNGPTSRLIERPRAFHATQQ